MLNTRNSQHLGSRQPANNVKFGTKTAEIFMTKVEIVYLLAGLLSGADPGGAPGGLSPP